MENAIGTVFRYGDNVDTDVIIPARYLNSSDPAELATHCMEDIDKDFVKKVQKGYTMEAVAEDLEESVDTLRPIYEAVEKAAPDYDAEKIYESLDK